MTPEILGRIIGGEDVDPMDRLIRTLDELAFIVPAARQVGARIGLTSGSFDLGHIGHTRYTRKGWKRAGSDSQVRLMFVAVEEDEKITQRKGPNRPVIPFEERVELMASTRWADVLVAKKANHPKWEITRIMRPDVLLAVEGTYSPEQVVELQKICGEVYIVPRQAENSTSNQVRKIQIGGADQLKKLVHPLIGEKLDLALKSAIDQKLLRVPHGVSLSEVVVLLNKACEEAIAQAYSQVKD